MKEWPAPMVSRARALRYSPLASDVNLHGVATYSLPCFNVYIFELIKDIKGPLSKSSRCGLRKSKNDATFNASSIVTTEFLSRLLD